MAPILSCYKEVTGTVVGWCGMVWSAGCIKKRYPSDKRKKLLRSDEIFEVRESCKIPEFSEKSPLSGAEKHRNFQVTSCHPFVSTNVDFAYIESE